MAIVLTEKAASEVKRIIADQKIEPEMVLRVGVTGGGCSGFSYALGFDKTHAEARLRFEGRLETGAKDGYGHLGRYTGQVTILRLLDATRENPRS